MGGRKSLLLPKSFCPGLIRRNKNPFLRSLNRGWFWMSFKHHNIVHFAFRNRQKTPMLRKPFMFQLTKLFLFFLFFLVSLSSSNSCRDPTIITTTTTSSSMSTSALNVLGGTLRCCCLQPKTGFLRNGFCETGPHDRGKHTVCAIMTNEFLSFTRRLGNDLSTPVPQYGFPGLKPGDNWCLCVSRWKEAMQAGVAPPVVLEATNIASLEVVTLEQLKEYAVVVDDGPQR